MGAHGWVVDNTGHGGGSILHAQGLSSWPTVGLFWAPDLHLQRMLLSELYFTFHLPVYSAWKEN